MPIYTYRCTACSHTFEVLILGAGDVPTACPQCGGAVERTFSGSVGFVFKGSGFYITDYARKNASSNGKDHNPGSSSETSSAKTTNAKE